MDFLANIKQQREIAAEILAIYDLADDMGEYTEDQEIELCDLAVDLATLVEALDGWMRKGGFSPWSLAG